MELSAAIAPCPTALAKPRPPRTGVHGGDAPLSGLAGSALSRRFRHWRGASGRRYLFSVFPLDLPGALEEIPRFADAVVLAVECRDERRRILVAGETGSLPDLFHLGTGYDEAAAAGANEIHVHLLSETASERSAMLRDLAGA